MASFYRVGRTGWLHHSRGCPSLLLRSRWVSFWRLWLRCELPGSGSGWRLCTGALACILTFSSFSMFSPLLLAASPPHQHFPLAQSFHLVFLPLDLSSPCLDYSPHSPMSRYLYQTSSRCWNCHLHPHFRELGRFPIDFEFCFLDPMFPCSWPFLSFSCYFPVFRWIWQNYLPWLSYLDLLQWYLFCNLKFDFEAIEDPYH